MLISVTYDHTKNLIATWEDNTRVTLVLHLLCHLGKPYMRTVIENISKAELHV